MMGDFRRKTQRLRTPRLDVERKYELVAKEDGTHELVDNSRVSFEPTEEQLLFLERLFWDWEFDLDEDKAVKSVGGQMSSVKRWKRDPAFLALYKNEAQKAVGLGIEQAKLMVLRTQEGLYQPDKDERWAATQMLKIEDSIRQTELKLISIHNTQNNFFGATVDMSDEKLKEIISGGVQDSPKKAVEAGAG